MLEAYNRGPGTYGARDHNTGTGRRDQRRHGEGPDIGKGKYLATVFLLSSDRRRYGELILSQKKRLFHAAETLPENPYQHVRANGCVRAREGDTGGRGEKGRPEFQESGRQLQNNRGRGSWRWRRHREKYGVLTLCRGSPEEELSKTLKKKRKTKSMTAAPTINALR